MRFDREIGSIPGRDGNNDGVRICDRGRAVMGVGPRVIVNRSLPQEHRERTAANIRLAGVLRRFGIHGPVGQAGRCGDEANENEQRGDLPPWSCPV